jgi:hypothetical protein
MYPGLTKMEGDTKEGRRTGKPVLRLFPGSENRLSVTV